ncbi:hypothetical protein ACOTWR_06480 [Aliarcobacter butzleri]|uniref:hypothetical protein n=1 Tax=Aliarcobacter butzleri TaxID=28197 RepID=UPI0021B1EB7B|nr:hypothetical protein [Aliarcobacter butzleri]MCT7564536.1 hypothetical protein [Aliarcobacter butzleri]MCT7578696.1 hypothetical protein [Aliarcobacter butzleri]
MKKSIFGAIAILVLLTYIGFYAGKSYSDNITSKYNNIIYNMQKDFFENKEIFCDGYIISIKNGWNYNKEKEVFIKDERFIHINKCALEELHN